MCWQHRIRWFVFWQRWNIEEFPAKGRELTLHCWIRALRRCRASTRSILPTIKFPKIWAISLRPAPQEIRTPLRAGKWSWSVRDKPMHGPNLHIFWAMTNGWNGLNLKMWRTEFVTVSCWILSLRRRLSDLTRRNYWISWRRPRLLRRRYRMWRRWPMTHICGMSGRCIPKWNILS